MFQTISNNENLCCAGGYVVRNFAGRSFRQKIILILLITARALGSTTIPSSPINEADKNEILLQNRQFIPEVAAKLSISKITGHAIIQFEEQIDNAIIDRLASYQINILEWIPRNAVMAYIPDTAQVESIPGIRWVGKLNPSDKISIHLNQSLTKGFILVDVFPDVTDQRARSVISAVQGEIIENHYLAPKTYLVRATEEIATNLSMSDRVSWIWPASDAIINGEPVRRCGGILTTLGPLPNYVKINEGWDGPGQGSASLKYHFVNGTSDMSGEWGIVEDALYEWAKYAQITWTETSLANQNRSVDIKWATGCHGDSQCFDGPGGILAHAASPPPDTSETLAGDVHFDDDENWCSGCYCYDTDLFSVALHEIGHSLGLDESDNSDAVMYPYYQCWSDEPEPLHQDDIDGIRSIYASRCHSCFINITSPSGSSVWECGNCYYITWNSECNRGNKVKIELYKGSSLVQTITSSTSDDGSHYWCVPADMTPASNYRIKISDKSDSSCAYGYSSYFEITCACVRVTSPSSSSIWECNRTYPISWSRTPHPTDMVDIWLTKGAGWWPIDSAEDDGSHNWKVPTWLEPGCGYWVRVQSTLDSSCYGESDTFCITCPTPPDPPSGLTHTANTLDSITWSWMDNSDNEDGFRGHDASHTVKFTAPAANATSNTETGLSPNTEYERHVHAYNDFGESSPSNSWTAWTLPADPCVTCDLETGNPAWPVDTVFTFTNDAGFGGGGVDHYDYIWDQNETYTFNGSELNWSSETLQLTGSARGKWYLHLLSYNANDDAGGMADLGPYHVLDEPNLHPEPNTTQGTCNTIYWDPVAGANEYYAECANDANFTNIDANSSWIPDTNYEFCGLTLGQTYYYSVKARTEPNIETWLQTSQADFETDTLTDTTATADGNVVLAGGGGTPTVDTVGSTSSNITSAGYLNCFLTTTETILTQIEVYIGITTSRSIEFVVYEGGASFSDTFNRIHSSTLASSGTGTKFYSSGPISVPLEAGKHYLIGAVYSGSVAIYYNGCSGHSSPSFGSHIGYASCTFPSPSTRTAVSSNCTFHHRYTTAQATGYTSPGDIVSTAIDMPADGNWGVVDFNTITPADTELTVDILPTAGSTPIPGYQNVSSGADLSGIGDPTIRLRANLSTADANNTPVLHNWSVTYTDPAGVCESNWSNVEFCRQWATPGDFDNNGIVNFADFAILASQYGQSPGSPSADIAPEVPDGFVDMLDVAVFCEHWLDRPVALSDFDADGDVDFVDFAILASQWFQAPGSPSADIAPAVLDGFVDMIDMAVFAEEWLYTPTIPGDFDADRDVDFVDFAILASQYGQPPGSPSADIAPEVPDGFVDYLDLAVFVENWLLELTCTVEN